MTYSSEVLADSPLAYWRLGESSGTTAADATGGGNAGTYHGSPTLGATGLLTADTNTAVTLNGSSQWIDDASLSVPGSTWTVEFWCKYTNSATAVLLYWNTAAQNTLQVAQLTGGLTATVYQGTSGTNTTAKAVNDGTRHHVVVTYDGSSATLYVDGSQVGSALTLAVNAGATIFNVGRRNNSTFYWAGTVDEVAVYPSALSGTRVLAHYVAGTHVGAQTISPSGIASAGVFGTATVANENQILTPTGIAPAEAFGSLTVTPGAVDIAPSGVASVEAFGTATVEALIRQTIIPSGIASGEAFSTATVAPGAVGIAPAGIASSETFGTAAVSQPGTPQTISPTGIGSGEAFGTAAVVNTSDGSILCDWSGLDVEIDTIPGMVDGSITADWGGLAIHATGAAYTSTPPAIARPSFALYAADGQTWVANLPTAIGSWQEELNAPGSITFTLPLADASAIDFGMIVKAFWQGECRQAARITSWSTDLAVDGTRWRTFDTQPGILSLLGDGVVFPEYGFDRTSGDQRTFGAMSGLDRLTDNLESDDWFQPSVWHHPAGFTMDSDTGFRAGYYTTGAPAAIRAADPSWIAMNDPYELLPGNSVMWVRRRLINYGDDFDYQILVAADNTCTLWLDGQQILDPQPTAGAGWRTTRAVTGTLTKGVHMLAVKVINKGHPSRIAFACAVQRLDDHGNVVDPAWNCSRKGHSGWAVNDGTGPPFWERGQIIASLIGENAALGVDGCQLITVAIPNRVDSTGVPWNHRGEYTFDVGTSVLDVTQQLCDEGMDVALDPEDLTLRGYVRKGRDRSAAVTLDLGSPMAADTENLKSYQVASVGPQWNTALMHLNDGTWVQIFDAASADAVGTRVQLLTLGSTADPQSATDAATAQFAEVASTSRQVTAEPSVLIGALAYRDYQLGDSISVPIEDGTDHMKARVLAITVDATGEVVRAWPEFIQDPT